MSAATLGCLPCLWGLAVVVGGWRHRPRPHRARHLPRASGPSQPSPSPVDRLGAALKAVAGLGDQVVTDRRVGWTLVGAGAGLLVSPVVALGVIGLSMWSLVATGARRRRQVEGRLVGSLPDTIDLFVLVAGAGLPVQRSVQMVAARARGPVGEAMRAASRQIDAGRRTADALEGVAEALGEPVRPLVSVLCASARYGTPLVPALERLAAESRNDRRRRAEEAARRVPVKMLFPLVLCTLPAFALLTVVPLLIGAFGSLRL